MCSQFLITSLQAYFDDNFQLIKKSKLAIRKGNPDTRAAKILLCPATRQENIIKARDAARRSIPPAFSLNQDMITPADKMATAEPIKYSSHSIGSPNSTIDEETILNIQKNPARLPIIRAAQPVSVVFKLLFFLFIIIPLIILILWAQDNLYFFNYWIKVCSLFMNNLKNKLKFY